MARLPLPQPTDPDLDPQVRAFFGSMGSLGGGDGPPNILSAMANHPAVATAFVEFATVAYFACSLTPAHRELAYLTASAVNRCHY